MKLRRANKLMLEKYGDILNVTSTPLPKSLRAILNDGFVEMDGCVFLRRMVRSEYGYTSSDRLRDERSANHLHMDDYTKENSVATAIAWLAKVSEKLAKQFPDYQFWGDISETVMPEPEIEDGAVVCFYRVRDGEDGWMTNNLEDYKINYACEYDL